MGGRDRTLHVAVAAVHINDLCRRHSCLVSRSSTGSVWSLYGPPTVFSECAAGVSRQRSKVAPLNPGRRLDCKNCLTPDCGAVRLAKLLTEALRSRSRCSELQLPLSFFPKTTSESNCEPSGGQEHCDAMVAPVWTASSHFREEGKSGAEGFHSACLALS